MNKPSFATLVKKTTKIYLRAYGLKVSPTSDGVTIEGVTPDKPFSAKVARLLAKCLLEAAKEVEEMHKEICQRLVNNPALWDMSPREDASKKMFNRDIFT